MQKITKSFVDKVTPPPFKPDGKPAQKFYRDDFLKGFALRVTSAGSKSFIVEKRIDGKVKRITLGKYGSLTAERARKQAQALIGDIATGGNPIAKRKADKAERVTLQQVLDTYLRTHNNLKPSTIHDYRYAIEIGLSSWLNKPLLSITKDMVEAQHTKLGERSHARANNTMRVLRALFYFAMDQYENGSGNPIIAVNPVSRLGKNRAWFKVDRKRTLIKPHQLAPWYQGTLQLNQEVTRDYLHFLLFTGLRRSEAARMTWKDVDLTGRTFTIPDTKNSEPHTLPLSDFLYELLMRRYATKEDDWVFPSPRGNSYLQDPKKSVARVGAISQVPFALHDLRRTFITIAESLDIPAYALKQLLNHKSPNDVTAGYIVTDVERLRKPMQKISAFILNQCLVED